LLGSSLLKSGEFRNSVEALYTAVKFNNKEALAIAGLSEIAYYEHHTRDSYDGLRSRYRDRPLEPDYYLSLARACSRLEIYNEAADAYQRFLDVTPKTDVERRARIRGLIDFYRYLGNTKIHRTGGKEVSSAQFDLINHRPFITVTVNGKESLRFVVDTGASLSVISDKAAARLGVRAVASGGNARAVGGSGVFPIVYGLLDFARDWRCEDRCDSCLHPHHPYCAGYSGKRKGRRIYRVVSLGELCGDARLSARQMTLDRTLCEKSRNNPGRLDAAKTPDSSKRTR
jgi:tetratricopeptide (TPR) repeat protein